MSLLVDVDEEVLAKRTHQMTDRLPWRIFGLIHAHPHPKSPETTLIRNKNGRPLRTALDGEPAKEFLIDADEMARRRKRIQKVCRACHSSDWVDGQWKRFENTIRTTNKMTRTATEVLLKAAKKGAADLNSGLFDEALEKKWVEQWLFYGNSTRFASPMMGADYGVFANGRWYMAKNVRVLVDWLRFLLGTRKNMTR